MADFRAGLGLDFLRTRADTAAHLDAAPAASRLISAFLSAACKPLVTRHNLLSCGAASALQAGGKVLYGGCSRVKLAMLVKDCSITDNILITIF